MFHATIVPQLGPHKRRTPIGCPSITLVIIAAAIALAQPADIQEADQAKASRLTSTEIREAIVADLDDTESLRVDRMDVSVHDGLVTLSGRVESLMDKRRASSVAKRTRDVQAVLNQLIVQASDRSDEEIRDDVVMRLRANDSLDRPEIAVAVNQGEVAITGEVDSLAEKRLAEIAAAGVRGVTSLQNQLTVGLSRQRSDEELREEIAGLIVNSVYLDNVEIDVRVENHVASLSGTVGSAAQKEQLEQTAEIWGVIDVDVDQVSIDPDLRDDTQRKKRFAAVSDDAIERAIDRVFFNDPIVFVAADSIGTNVASGVVTLHGTVTGVRIKDKAERLAMDVVGVTRVHNELNVEYVQGTPPDATIIELTQQALLRSSYVDRREIRVHCQRTHVSLYGVVDTQFEKNIAGWLAGGVPGVVHVNNSLAIEKQGEPKSDEEIERDLKRKLQTALFDESNDINVQVTNGVAILSGTVDTWRQWQAALDLAIEAGARHPHSMIDVRYHPPHGASRIYVPR